MRQPLVLGLPHSPKKCGGRRAAPQKELATAAQQQHVRRSARRARLHGGHSATTRRAAAAAHPHEGLLPPGTPPGCKDRCSPRRTTTPRAEAAATRQVWRPPSIITCGGHREATIKAAAAAQQQRVWRPSPRSTTTRAAAAAQQQHVRRFPCYARSHGGDSATTRRPAAAVQPHQGPLLRGPFLGSSDTCGGRRTTTPRTTAVAQQPYVRRPPRNIKRCGRRAKARAAAAV